MPGVLRVILASVGLVAICVPLWEFRRVFLHPSLLTVFFGFIAFVAFSIGAGFVAAAFYGEDQTWLVRGGEIEIARRSVLREMTTVVRRDNLRDLWVQLFTDSDGPDVYRVMLALHSGETFDSPAYQKRANAEELAQRLRAALGAG